MTESEQEGVFFAIFKLFNCHLFETSALEFVERSKFWWNSKFIELIDKVEPS